MTAYWRKLSSSIIASSVWSESASTRLVWITMIAMSDQSGHILASIPGLARLAGVPVEDTAEAIRVLSSPDAHDRSKVDEGRRIAPIDGGWRLINFARYQGVAKIEAGRARKRDWWEKNRSPRRATRPLDSLTRPLDCSESESESGDREGKGSKTDPSAAEQPQDLPAADADGAAVGVAKRNARKGITEQAGLAGDCARLWSARYEGACPEWGRHVVALNKLGQRHDHGEIVAAFGRYVEEDEEFVAGKAHPLSLFLANPDRWLIDRANDPMSQLSEKGRRNARTLRRVVEKLERGDG